MFIYILVMELLFWGYLWVVPNVENERDENEIGVRCVRRGKKKKIFMVGMSVAHHNRDELVVVKFVGLWVSLV